MVDLTLPAEKVNLNEQARLGQARLGQASFGRVDGNLLKLPSVDLSEPPAEETDSWVNAPREMYGLFGPSYYDGNVSSELMLADKSTPFYYHDESDPGTFRPSAFREALSQYWSDFVEDTGSEYFRDGAGEYSQSTDSVLMDWNDRRIRVPYEAYLTALTDTLYGRSDAAASDVDVFEVMRYANDDQYDDDDGLYMTTFEDYALPGERGMKISSRDLANRLDLANFLEEYVPNVGIARHINVDHFDDDSTRSHMTNPGKWRIIHGSSPHGLDDDDFMPANYYVIEPDDMFDNSEPEDGYH